MSEAAALSDASLRLHGVGHAFGPTPVLADVALTLPAGRVMALLGPSGGGKTTLLHLAAGLLTCREGSVHNGFARTAVMFQQPRLLPWQTTLDNIALGLRAQGLGRGEARRRAAEAAQAVGLDEAALAAWPQQLSGGMQSRAALARALVLAPGLLLMDEPFSALDIGLKRVLHRLLLAHVARHRTAVLMVTHDPAEALRLADEVLVIGGRPGRLVHRLDARAQAGAAAERDEAGVQALLAGLLGTPAVGLAFGLPGWA